MHERQAQRPHNRVVRALMKPVVELKNINHFVT
jgi:hypothetical protein